MGAFAERDVELRAICVRATICHRDYTTLAVPQLCVELISEGTCLGELTLVEVGGTTLACSFRVTSLHHEAWDEPMKDSPVVKASLAKL